MQKTCLALLCLLMLAFTLSGCGVPQEEYDAAMAELASSRSEIENLWSELASLRSQIEDLQGDLASSRNGIRPSGGLVAQSAKLTKVQDSDTEGQIHELENELEVIFNSTVTQDYQFKTSRWGTYQWMLTVPLRDYFYYKEKPRPASFARYNSLTRDERYYYFSEYIFMATDPYDDGLIESIVNNVDEIAVTENFNELDKVNLVIQFIQSLTYTEDTMTTPYNEYPQYPIETLFDRGGDCEDTSILAAAILTEMGFDVALLLFEEFDHMGLGINFPVKYGNSWIHEGKRYWYLDTTGGWSLGWCPEEYAETSAYVFPIGG